MNENIKVLTLARPSAETGWFFLDSQTGYSIVPHTLQLQTAQFPVPPRSPAQKGPIKTSHIPASLCLCLPGLLHLGKRGA